ncbi:MAG: hypothetical protein U0414_08370 [Polyangiaceae bacterium]
MAAIAFNPSKAVVFDLARGAVHVGGSSSTSSSSSPADGRGAAPSHVLVPADLFATLVDHYAGSRTLGHTIGGDIARRAAARIGQGSGTLRPPSAEPGRLRAVSLNEVVDLVGGELALLGLGSLRIERWGDAMLFALDPCALDERADAFVEGIIEGILEVGGGRAAHAAVIDRTNDTARVLVAGAAAVERARAMALVGTPFTEIVTELQEARKP